MQMTDYVITGGSSGIGQALSWRLAAQGNHVMVIGRNGKALQKTCDRFPEYISPIVADVSDTIGRETIVTALQSVQSMKGLIHAAGMVQPIMSLANIHLEQWRTIQAINVEAPLFLTQALLPQLHNARVLMLSSQVAHVAQPCLAPYCVSKAGVSMLYHCFNIDFRAWGVYTGSATPGIVDTPMFDELVANRFFPEGHQRFYQQVVDNHERIQPDVVACFLQWLLCDIDVDTFSAREWDIYDVSHHTHWVKGFSAPQTPGFA